MSQSDIDGPGLVGVVLGEAYRLTRLIGQGGMGTVYEGLQLRLGKRVAVKLMARELAANPEALARFRREAEVTSQLGHPHIVQVFDFGAAPGGEPYLVMEYLEGEDLEHRIRRAGRLSLPVAAHIVRQVASALAATHAQGIIHRDLKPANVFVLAVEGETDFVKVVDFGISKVKAAATRLTAALAVMGTPNYMSPEQAAGRVDEIDHQTDQWALACIAYELLAGRPPFIGEDVASLLYQVIHEAPTPIRATTPGLSGEVEAVLGRALSKSRLDRFPTMLGFARAFEAAAAGPPSAASAPGSRADPAPAPSRAARSTTFSAAAGEALAAPAIPSARKGRGRRLALGGAAAALAGGLLFVGSRLRGPVSTTSPVVPAPASPSGSPAAPARPAAGGAAAVRLSAPPATGATGVAAAVASEKTSPPAGRLRRSPKSGPSTRAAGAPAWPPPAAENAPAWPPPAPGGAPPAASARPASTSGSSSGSSDDVKPKRIIRDIKRKIIEKLGDS